MAAGFTRWPWWRRWFGRRSEKTAARFLRSRGLRILAANYDDRRGEIDLLALDRDILVIVEVRSTESRTLEETAASVDSKKQQRLSNAAKRFLARRNLLGMTVRFDVLAVRWPDGAKAPDILHLPNAFEARGRFQMFD